MSSSSSSIQLEKENQKISNKEKYTYIIAIIIASIGAINWGLTLIHINLVSVIPSRVVRKLIYFIISIAGFISLFSAIKWYLKK
jgi:uncharacterized membrane protein YuzA (DUF378 family)